MTSSRLSPLAKPFTSIRHDDLQPPSQSSSENFQLNGGHCDRTDYSTGKNSLTVKIGKPAAKPMNDNGKVPTPSAGKICSEFVISGCNNEQIEPHLLLKDESQLMCNGKVLIDKGKSIDYDDSDIDSPCWKGTQQNQSTSKIEAKETKCLNPRALQFHPGSGKIDEYFHEKECANSLFPGVAESFECTETYFGPSTSATKNFVVPQTTHGVFEHVDAKIKNGVEETNGLNPLAPQFYPGSDKRLANSIDDSPNFVNSTSLTVVRADRKSLVGSSSNNQASLMEGCYESDFSEARGSENAVLTSFVTSTVENVVNSSFYGVDNSSESSKNPSGKCNSPEIRLQLLINSMHEMSEKLKQNCSNGFHSLNVQQHKKIDQILSNLYMCTRNEDQQNISLPESIGQSKLSEFVKSADDNELNMRMKNIIIPHRQVKQNVCSDITVERQLDPFSSNIKAIGRYNEISTDARHKSLHSSNKTRLIRNTSNVYPHEAEEDIYTQALLYQKLWLETEEELQCLKYKMGQMQIKQHIRIESMDNSSLRGRGHVETEFRGNLRVPDMYWLE